MNTAVYKTGSFHSIMRWRDASRIDYHMHYLMVYVAYNAWFREVAQTTNDRQAIDTIKKRYVIWDDFVCGRSMQALRAHMHQLVDITQKEPFSSSTENWNGEVNRWDDWRSLIEYWYQVRCRIVHGMEVRTEYSRLAYETLSIFIDEITYRAQRITTVYDAEKSSSGVPSSVWYVDMQRVPETET